MELLWTELKDKIMGLVLNKNLEILSQIRAAAVECTLKNLKRDIEKACKEEEELNRRELWEI